MVVFGIPAYIIAPICWFAFPVIVRATIWKAVMCRSKKRLDGKVVLVTGANTGLGKVTAADLSSRGALVYMACRNMEKAENTRQDILKTNPSAKLKLLKLDLGSLKSVRECAENFLNEETTLDIFVANAGFGTLEHRLTEDGVEWHLACNHLGHFYLTRLLLEALDKAGSASDKSRIVVVSSRAHQIGVYGIKYDALQSGSRSRGSAYGQSKLANILFVRHLDKLLGDRNITVNALHPGTVKTEFFRHYIPSFLGNAVVGVIMFPLLHLLSTEVEGAQTQIWAAVGEELEGVSGKYLQNCAVSLPSRDAQDESEAEKLWRWSCEHTGLTLQL